MKAYWLIFILTFISSLVFSQESPRERLICHFDSLKQVESVTGIPITQCDFEALALSMSTKIAIEGKKDYATEDYRSMMIILNTLERYQYKNRLYYVGIGRFKRLFYHDIFLNGARGVYIEELGIYRSGPPTDNSVYYIIDFKQAP